MRYRDRFYLVFEEFQTATLAEVRAAEARLGARFPDGYAEYVTELGEGTFANALRVALPGAGLVEWTMSQRGHLVDHFYWDQDGPFLPAHVPELISIGTTWGGDELVSLASRPDELYVLPRHQDRTYRVGPGLDAALDWFCDSRMLSTASKLRYFEPSGDREEVEATFHLPYEVVRDAIVGLGVHDLVAYEERREDRGDACSAEVSTDDGEVWQVADCRRQELMLLVKEFGGNILVDDYPLERDVTTGVSIEYVAGGHSPKFDRVRDLLGELQARERQRKRRHK